MFSVEHPDNLIFAKNRLNPVMARTFRLLKFAKIKIISYADK